MGFSFEPMTESEQIDLLRLARWRAEFSIDRVEKYRLVVKKKWLKIVGEDGAVAFKAKRCKSGEIRKIQKQAAQLIAERMNDVVTMQRREN